MQKELQTLIDGNNRFINGSSIHPNRSQEVRSALVAKQTPFATIITCSDSRVPPEILFDVGLGDIFVIRTAGHILTSAGLATLEYAVHHLHTKLIIVMGHTHCGAVKSAVEDYEAHNTHSDLQELVNRITPLVEKARQEHEDEEKILNTSINYNIYETIDYIKKSNRDIREMVDRGDIYLIPAKYDIDSGKVEILEKNLLSK